MTTHSIAHEPVLGQRPFTMEDVRDLITCNYLVDIDLSARSERADKSPAARYLRIVQGANYRNPRGHRPMPIMNALWKYNRLYYGVFGRPEFLQMLWDCRIDLVEALNDERGWVRLVPRVVAGRAA